MTNNKQYTGKYTKHLNSKENKKYNAIMDAEGSPFSFVNKDLAVLPWGPEVIDITEVTITRTKRKVFV